MKEQKIKNAINFYLAVNQLKYQLKYNSNQSIADHIYGTMILATAFNSEYKNNNLAFDLRLILFSELAKVNNLSSLEYLKKGKTYFDEYNEYYEKRAEIINIYKTLDKNLYYFYNIFLKENNIQITNYKQLFKLAVSKGYYRCFAKTIDNDLEIFRFYHLNQELKNKIRSGWDYNHWNVSSDRIERISEHVVGTEALALALDSEFNFDINLDKVLTTLCIHEVGEIKIGDITPFDNITPEEKKEREHLAIKDVIGNLTKKEEMIADMFEFDEHKTNESLYGHYCDKLEADIQSKIYQDNGYHHDLTKQENNVVLKNQKIKDIIDNGAETAFDVWYYYDKPIYEKNLVFAKTLDYVKNTKLK